MDGHVLLATSGLDSSLALFYLRHERKIDPKILYVDLKGRYSDTEIRYLLGFTKAFDTDFTISRELDLSKWEEESANIQMRNALLIETAAYYGSDIYLVVQKDEMTIPDRSEDFFQRTTDYLNFLWADKIKSKERKSFFVDPVFSSITKTEALGWFIKTFGEEKALLLLMHTFSCFNPKYDIQCKACPACMRYWAAWRTYGFLTNWDKEIMQSDVFKTYTERANKGDLGPSRSKEWIKLITDIELVGGTS